MISDEKLQADLITKIKQYASGTYAVRELQYQGDEFIYPEYRLDLENNEYTFDEQARCRIQTLEFSVYIFSEERSSKQCSQLKGAIENFLTGLGWMGTYARFVQLRLQENIPAVREDERTWRSQLRYQTRITTQ